MAEARRFGVPEPFGDLRHAQKAELEECLEKVHALLVRAQVEGFMALERSEGDLSRYPQFRWMIPFYTLALALIAIVLVWPPMARFRPTIGAVP